MEKNCLYQPHLQKSDAHQIEYWAKIGKAALDNTEATAGCESFYSIAFSQFSISPIVFTIGLIVISALIAKIGILAST